MSRAEKTINVSPAMLKGLKEMRDSGMSVEDIAKELDISTRSTERILKLLGCLSGQSVA
jgi:hypothetical protein